MLVVTAQHNRKDKKVKYGFYQICISFPPLWGWTIHLSQSVPILSVDISGMAEGWGSSNPVTELHTSHMHSSYSTQIVNGDCYKIKTIKRINIMWERSPEGLTLCCSGLSCHLSHSASRPDCSTSSLSLSRHLQNQWRWPNSLGTYHAHEIPV